MILELAILNVRLGQEDYFEKDFAAASVRYISSIDGYLSHELLRCMETPSRYVLLAKWTHLEAHTVGFSIIGCVSGVEADAASLL